MGNMSYCRYQNTLSDLQDCFDDMQERLEKSQSGTIDGSYTMENYENYLSSEEKRAQERLLDLCREIVELVR